MTTESGRLQRELKQSRPFATAAEEAVVGVLRTADLLRRRFAGLLEPFGISNQQYNVLRILRGAGERGLPTLEIADRMVEHSPGITRLIDRLVAHGWAHRSRCSEDRRVVYCLITARGIELLEEIDQPLRAAHDGVLANLTAGKRVELIALLDLLRGGEAIPGA